MMAKKLLTQFLKNEGYSNISLESTTTNCCFGDRSWDSNKNQLQPNYYLIFGATILTLVGLLRVH